MIRTNPGQMVMQLTAEFSVGGSKPTIAGCAGAVFARAGFKPLT